MPGGGEEYDTLEAALQALLGSDISNYENAFDWFTSKKHEPRRADVYLEQLLNLLSVPETAGRDRLVEVLGYSKNPKLVGVLTEELSHPHPSVRFWAVQSLYQNGSLMARSIADEHLARHPDDG